VFLTLPTLKRQEDRGEEVWTSLKTCWRVLCDVVYRPVRAVGVSMTDSFIPSAASLTDKN
jgi:hypothetical protein